MPNFRLGTAPDPPVTYRMGVQATWAMYRLGTQGQWTTTRLGIANAVVFRLGVTGGVVVFRLGTRVEAARFRLGIDTGVRPFRFGIARNSLVYRLGIGETQQGGSLSVIQLQPPGSGIVIYTPEATDFGVHTLQLTTWRGEELKFLEQVPNEWKYTKTIDQVVKLVVLEGETIKYQQHYPLDAVAVNFIAELRKKYLFPTCKQPKNYELVSSLHVAALDNYRIAQYEACENILTWISEFAQTVHG